MLKINTRHLKTGEELSSQDILGLIDAGIALKKLRKDGKNERLLLGKSLALVFDKPSLRTRFSFTVAMNELGGHSIESISSTRKQERPEDLIRVISGYCHGVVVRTHDDQMIEKMAANSAIPVINGLSEYHHPCQTLADLMTLREVFGKLQGLTLAYIGDGNNVLNSLLLISPLVGVNISYCCPQGFQPNPMILKRALHRALEYGTEISSLTTPENAVAKSDAVYTDVWTSMGFEEEKEKRESAFSGFQVNERLMSFAAPHAVVMHCLPMERGKEISETLPDRPSSVIFQQSENRLHVQKALLIALMSN